MKYSDQVTMKAIQQSTMQLTQNSHFQRKLNELPQAGLEYTKLSYQSSSL